MYICICVLLQQYTSSVCTEHQQYNTTNFIEECTCSPSGMMFFYLVTWGWKFTLAYVEIQSINIRRHMERRHVNREEFREYAPYSA